MSIENITAVQAATIFIDDLAARRHEDDVLYPGPSTVTDEERSAIARVLDAKCKAGNGMAERLDALIGERLAGFFSTGDAQWRLAASSGMDGGEEEKEYADLRFVFVSDAKAPKDRSWRAVLEIPGKAKGSQMLTLKVSEEDGFCAGNGLFTVAGTTVLVENGIAEIQMDVFLVGIRNSAVSFQREGDAVSVSGNLMFF